MSKTDVVQGSLFDDPFGGGGFMLDCRPGCATWVRFHPETGVLEKCELYEHDPILEDNSRRLLESQGKRWGDGQIVASIPNFMLYGDGYYAKARQANDKKAMKKFLNDSDNRKLRTFGGTI